MSEDFAELFASYESQRKTALKAGDKISGTVISIGQKAAFVDCGASVDGIVDREELLNDAGELTVAEGDTLELYVVGVTDDSVRLSKAMTGVGGLNMLQDAINSGVPVEGKVREQIKGGFHVEVLKHRAFCPVSQIDARYVANPEDYVGQTLQFRITKVSENGRNIVVSRRALLEEEQKQASADFFEKVGSGDIVEGTVTRLAAFGAFVELAPGLEGLIHISELDDQRVDTPERVVHVGEEVNVKVLELNAAKNRIGLSRKGAIADQERENIKAYTRKNDEKSSGLSLGDALKAAMKTKPE